MTSPLYHRLDQRIVNTIKEAFVFLESKIWQYGENKKKIVDKIHHSIIDSEIENEIDRIKNVENFLDTEAQRFGFEMEEDFMDIVRSALEIYLRNTKEAKSKLGLPGFDSKIQEITGVMGLKVFEKGRTDIYDKYYGPSRSLERVEVFLSYSHNDRVLAGKIAAFLRGREIDVFLAHEDIEISEEWKNEIFKHLGSCAVLLALLTPSFEKSVWTNQETGYMLGRRNGKVVPLIVEESDLKRIGFLEALQGIPIKAETLDQSFKEILSAIVK